MPSFILRNLDPEFWSKVQAKANAEGVTVKALILRLLSQWLAAALVAALTVGCTSPNEPSPLPDTTRGHGIPTRLELAATSGIGAQAGSASLTVHVLDAFSVPVKDVSVALETTIGTLAPTALVTDENGRGTALLTAPAGSVKVTATIPNGLTNSTQVAVQTAQVIPEPVPNPPPPLPNPIPTPTPNPPLPPPTTPAPVPPTMTVNLVANPAAVIVGHTSQLSAEISASNGATMPTSYTFDCDGNGTIDATVIAPAPATTVCTYPTIGNFTAKVTATSSTNTVSATTRITVTAAPPPAPDPTPVVTVSCAQQTAPPVTAHCVVSATLSGSPVPSGNITGATWDFGGAGVTTASGNEGDHTYTGPATYQVLVSNVTVTGTSKKGTGSTSVDIK